jgi:hypothetical protein
MEKMRNTDWYIIFQLRLNVTTFYLIPASGTIRDTVLYFNLH